LQVASQHADNISLHGEAKYLRQETVALLLPLLLPLSFYNKRHSARMRRLKMVIKGYIPIERFPPRSSIG
jgi:hypothetical protein